MVRRGILTDYSGTFAFFMRVGDVFVVLVAALIGYILRFDQWPIPVHYQIAILLAVLFIPLLFSAAGIYRSWRGGNVISELRRVTLALCGVIAALIVVSFVTKTSSLYSRLWLGGWAVSAWTLLMVYHILLRLALREMRRRGMNARRVVIVGAGDLAKEVIRRLRVAPWTGIQVVGLYDDNAALHHKKIEGIRVRGAPASFQKLLRRRRIDELWLALPLRAEQRMKEILHDLRHSTVTIRFVPDIFGFRLIRHSVGEIAGIPIMDLNTTPMIGINRIAKAVIDRILAAVILLVISPVMLAIAIAIRLTSAGPIFFRQRRHGWDGKPIKVYKFRTMVVHQEEDGNVTQATRNDPRVTPLGAFLRRTSLDELPQFINVLQGRMSIVGPRPHAMEHNEKYKDLVDAYMQRHKVKPGITGWAQINGLRGETDTVEKMQKRVEYDLFYIENWSLWMDFKIILQTVFKGFNDKNAY